MIEPLPDAVGGDPAVIVAVGRLIKRIDRGRCAMREQRSLLFPVKRCKNPPEITFVLGKAGLPASCLVSMASADALSFKPGAEAGNAGVRIAISRQPLDEAKR